MAPAIGPALFYAVTSIIPGMKHIIGSIGKTAWNWFIFTQIAIIITSSIIISLSFRTLRVPTGTHSFLLSPSIIVAILSVGTFVKYNIIRAHINGALLQSTTMGNAVIAGLILIHAIVSACVTEQDAITILPFLLGSIVTLLFATTCAITADAWHVVGTGQFQMVSVDTIGIMFYFVLPICILGVRAMDKYHTWIEMAYVTIAEVVVHLIGSFKVGKVEKMMADPMTLFQLVVSSLTGIIAMGVPLLNQLCPLCGHLYGRTYTHGQPNTGKVAICISFNVLNLSKEDGAFMKRIIEWGKSKTGKLNVFVSAQEMKDSSSIVKSLVDAGHCVGIRLDKSKGSKPTSQLNDAVETYQKLIGKKPTWYHAGLESFGQNKACYSHCQKLGLRIAQWSTLLKVGEPIPGKSLAEDLTRHNGGSFIYITSRTGSSKEERIEAVLIDTFEVLSSTIFGTGAVKKNFDSDILDMVAKEDNYMDL